MEEENKSPESTESELVKKFRDIGLDLWGARPAGTAYGETGRQAAPCAQEPAKPVSKEKTESKKNTASIDALWKIADEIVDWTEVLSHEVSPDGLTSQRMWNFFRRMAEKVLQGDTGAYAEVLTTVNPVGDLTGFTDGIRLRVPGADRVEAVFEASDAYLKQDKEKYLCALSVRIARDLLACLPVSEVGVTARKGETTLLEVTYPREKMNKRNFSFLDPTDLTQECGGWCENL